MATKTHRSPELGSKILILIRHAHRHKIPSSGEADNGLSPKGEKQARAILKHFCRVGYEQKPYLVSSPKKRCIETLEPIAKKSKLAIETHSLLDEGGSLKQKAEAFARWWRNEAPSLTLACSHGDVIPELARALIGASIELSKGGWMEFEIDPYATQPSLRWLLQEV